MLACALAPRPENLTADAFLASQSAARARKTERSKAGSQPRTKMEGAKEKLREMVSMLNALPDSAARHRISPEVDYGDRMICTKCGLTRNFDKKKEFFEGACVARTAKSLAAQAAHGAKKVAASFSSSSLAAAHGGASSRPRSASSVAVPSAAMKRPAASSRSRSSRT